MKNKIIFLVLLFLLFVSALVVCVSAEPFDLKSEEMSSSEKAAFWENIDFEVSDKPFSEEKLVCFNVSDNGMIALGAANTGIRRSVAVYDAELNFINRFYFDSYGNYFVAWKNDSLIIFMVRSSIAVLVSVDGTMLDIIKVENCAENTSVINKEFGITVKSVGGKKYKMTNGNVFSDLLSTSYASVVATEDSGNETFIYGSEKAQSTSVVKLILIIVCVLVFFLAVASVIVKSAKSYKQKIKSAGN